MTDGNISPQLRNKSLLPLVHPYLHTIRALGHSLNFLPHIVKTAVSLVSSAHHHHAAPPGRNSIQIAGQDGVTLVISHIGSKAQTDNQRPQQRYGIALQVFHGRDKIALRIGRDILRNQIKLTKVRFCLTKLHHRNIRIGGRPGKPETSAYGAPCRHTCHGRSMADLVIAWHDRSWIIGKQCRINQLLFVFRSIKKPLRRRPVVYVLIPDTENAAASIRIPEHLLLIADSRIQEPDDHSPPCQIQGCALNLQNAALHQRSGIKNHLLSRLVLHQSVYFRNGSISELRDIDGLQLFLVNIGNHKISVNGLGHIILNGMPQSLNQREIRQDLRVIRGHNLFPVCHSSAPFSSIIFLGVCETVSY